MVLHNGTILVTGSPNHIYSNPKHPLVAAFFSEYSSINGKIYYAHQIFLVDNSALKAVVRHSFYKGSLYLIEADLDGTVVYFTNPVALKENTLVSLEV